METTTKREVMEHFKTTIERVDYFDHNNKKLKRVEVKTNGKRLKLQWLTCIATQFEGVPCRHWDYVKNADEMEALWSKTL